MSDTTSDELSVENVLSILKDRPVQDNRTEEFYAVAQLLASGISSDDAKRIGETCVEMLERDQWWRSNGAFNDE